MRPLLYFVTKCIRFFITEYDSFIYKKRQLLQNAIIITKCVGTKIMKKWAETSLRKRQKDSNDTFKYKDI